MKKLILFIIIFHSLTSEMNATHIMGADISYKIIDTAVGKYRFRVTLYRDCSGIQFGGEQLQIRKTGVSTTIPLNLISSDDVTPVCKVPDVSSPVSTNCPSGPIGSNGIKGVERWIYEVDYVVGKNIGFAYFAWTSCCRNGSINTIAGASAANMWVQCLINTNIQNNSTTFTSPPIPYWCRLKQNTYNHGSVDSFDVKYMQINGINVERDSLVYELYAPFTAEATNTNAAANLQNPTVTYNTPLNKNNFLYTTTGVSFDPLTGHLSFTPSIAQDAIIAVAVKEYRAVPNASGNGYTRVLAGYVTRDIQVTVRDLCDDIIMPGVIADSLVNANYENSSTVNLKAYSKNNKIKFKIVGAPTQFIKSKVIVTPSSNLFTGFSYSQNIVRANNTDTLIGSISIDSVNTIGSDKFIIQVYYCSSIGMKHSQFYTLKINSYGVPTCSQFKNISYTKNGNVYQFNSSGSSSVPSPYTVSYNWTFSNGSTSTQKNPLISLPSSNSNWAKLKVCIDSGTTTICCDSSMRDSILNCNLTCSLIKKGDSILPIIFNNGNLYDITPKSYLWDAGNANITSISSKYIVTTSSGSFYYTYTDSSGCSTTCSYTISPCSDTSSVIVKTGISQTYPTSCNPSIPSSCYPNPFTTIGQGQSSSNRIIYKASELIAAGLSAGYFKSLAFNISNLSNPIINNFEIKIGQTTNNNAINASLPFTNFFPASAITLTNGWNYFNSSSGFFWDGASNILIEINSSTNYAMTNSNQFLSLNSIVGNEVAFKYSDTVGISASNSAKPYIGAGSTASKPQLLFKKCPKSTLSSAPCKNKEILVSYLGNTVVFSTNIPSGNHSYNWTFGDSATVNNSPNPSHTYAGVGFYLAKLKFCLRDSAQNIICCDSIMRTIAIYPPCNINANFGWASTSNGGTYQFIDSTTPIGTNYSYFWDFGDSTYSYSKNPIKSYTKNGTRTVCLIVTRYANTNNQVCRDTICKTINVTNVNPCNRFVPNFTWATTGGAYQFNNTTNLTGFNIVSVNFNISTGAAYNYNNPVHTFINNGYYSVTMTMTVFDATTGTNCTKSITKYISVNTSICGCLKAYYSYSKVGMSVNFFNYSSCIDTNTTYLYKFGNGATSTVKNPSYTYTLPGLYRVVLIVTRTVGATTCVDSTVKYIQVTTPNPCKDSGYQSSQTCQDYDYPVCGCDTITYKNYCFAAKAGVKQYSTGPCPNDTHYVKICGYVYNDFNKNCAYDTTDGKLANVPIKFNSTPIRYAYTNAAGFYTIYLPKGTYQLTQILTNSTFPRHQLCPASNGSITVAATTGGMTYCNNNFYDTMNTCQDLATSIHRIANITPGFTSMKYIKYQNNGATPITGVVLKYRFMAGLTVKATTTATYTVSGNVITWNLGTIAPYSIGYKYANFNTPITGIALGTTVIDSVWIEPISGDCNPANNLATYKDTCVGSWDPNDKSAYPADNIDTSIKQLDYLVRFQNTGTAPAHNVVIEDQIDANFDRSSLTVKASSHTMEHFYDDAGKLFFEFANIMLPDSGTDYEASQGYVAYSIKLKDGLSIGTQLKNTAHIFFDFNEAVITNTTVNTIVLKSTTGIQNQGKDMNISIFPNPTADRATIFIKLDKASQVSYSLYDLQGKVIFQNGSEKSQIGEFNQDLSLEGLTKGIYLLNITVNGKESSFKLVKE